MINAYSHIEGFKKAYNYGFQGQEKQSETGWSSFKWRNSIPELGRFFNVDPLSEDYDTWSVYAFSGNRVVDARELEGLEPEKVNKSDLPDDPMEFASMMAGGFNNLRASVSNLTVRVVNSVTGDKINRKYVVDEIGALVMEKNVPKETTKEKIVNSAWDLATIGVSFAGGPQGALMSQGGKAPAIKAIEEIKSATKYSHLKEPKTVGDGLKTTSAQRKRILAENMKQNGGKLRSDGDGRLLNMPKKNVKGQKADMNQGEIDHIKAKSKGGSNSNANLRVLSKEENIKKSNK